MTAQRSFFDPVIDGPRIARALDKVREALLSKPRRWWTLAELAQVASCSEAGASARLRDMRKAEHGGHVIAMRRVKPTKGALMEYSVADPTPDYPRAA